MEPTRYFQNRAILLAGCHVGPDIAARWDRFGHEEQTAMLPNKVDGTGFERRLITPEGLRIFTGVEVTDENVPPNYELLVLPAAQYALFEIDCTADIDHQFMQVGLWLDENKYRYIRTKWEEGENDYTIIWSGRYADEMICEMWVPLEIINEGEF